ncbi:unnamed protein product [Victoria cruziana]
MSSPPHVSIWDASFMLHKILRAADWLLLSRCLHHRLLVSVSRRSSPVQCKPWSASPSLGISLSLLLPRAAQNSSNQHMVSVVAYLMSSHSLDQFT